MQDETLSQPLPLPRPRGALATILAVALLAFALGGLAVGWLLNSGRLDFLLPGSAVPAPMSDVRARTTAAAPPSNPAADGVGVAEPATLGAVETRLALIEDRLSRIHGEANAASGNAARAEALLIAYAARRRIDQGEPLGFVEDHLRLRFGGAQPRAVQTIIAASEMPVTLDELSAQLDAAAPVLTGTASDESTWDWLWRELGSLFVVRRAPVPAVTPETRVARARLMLAQGRIDEAIEEVQRLPGADEAQAWIQAARRYRDTQQALDVIETAAMIEPRKLRDAEGQPVDRSSALAPPPAAPARP